MRSSAQFISRDIPFKPIGEAHYDRGTRSIRRAADWEKILKLSSPDRVTIPAARDGTIGRPAQRLPAQAAKNQGMKEN
jgi:hypothetical protein